MSNLHELDLPESDVVQFVGMNLEPLTGLATFANISEGFTLGFAEINFASDVDRLLIALKQRPECSAVQFEVLRLTDPQLRHLLEELKQILPTIPVEPGKKLVLVLCGLENAIGVIGEYPPILADLNFVRDILAKQVPHPIVFVLPDYAITRIAQYSRDFWAWSSGVFVFRTAQQTLDAVQTQMLQVDRLYTSDPHPVKQERIDLLQRLLMEYMPTGRRCDPGQLKNCLNILLELGNAYRSLSDYRTADQFYQQALTIARETGDRLGEAYTLKAIGDVLQFLKQSTEALDTYQQAIGICRQVGSQPGEANTLEAIGDVLQFLDRRTEALDTYQQAIGIYCQIGDQLGEANTLKAIGDVLQFLTRSTEALNTYQQAIGIYRQIGDRLGEANTLKAIGDVLQFLTRSTEALNTYQQAIGIYRQIGDQLGEANTLQAIGDVLKFLTRSTEALNNYQQAIGIYRQIGERLGEAYTLKAIGNVLEFLDRRTEALDNYQQAISIYRQVGSQLGEANTLKAIGDILQFLDRRTEALDSYQQAIGIFRQIGARLGEANVLQAFGSLQEDSQAGLDYLQHAQTIYQQIGSKYSQSRNLLFIANRQVELQDIRGAIESLQQSAALASDINFEPFQQYAFNKITELQQLRE